MNKIFHFHCSQSSSNSSLNMKFQRDINLLSFQYLIRRMLEDTEEISNIYSIKSVTKKKSILNGYFFSQVNVCETNSFRLMVKQCKDF